jgi:phage protein D
MADARKPDFQLHDDGSKVQDDVKSAVIAITVDERLDQASVCTVELRDEGARMSDGKRFKVGSELRVELGYVGGTKVVFEGEVTGWRGAFPRRGPETLVVMALDRFHRLRRERKRRSFLKMKDSEIVQQIASDHGFSVEAKPTSLAHDYVVQFNKSDADFLLERAALNGYELFIDGRKMVFRAPLIDGAPVATLTWHETLKHFSPVISLGKAHAAVKATAYDMKAKKPVSVTAKKGDELSLMGGTKTAADLASKLGKDPLHDPMQPMLSAEEADALAKGLLNKDAMRLVTGEGASQGNNLIRRGTVVEVDAIGDLLSGRYYVASALHTLTPAHGYTTTFRVRRTAIAKG